MPNVPFNNTIDPANTVSSIVVTDLNNDGKADIVYTQNNTMSIYISQGTGFKNITPTPITVSSNASPSFAYVYPLDLNNNGQKDLIYLCDSLSANNVQLINYNKIVFNTPLNNPLFVNNITDGNNNTSAITYSVYHDNTTKELTYPLRVLRGPMQIATGVENYNGKSNPWSNYTYIFSVGTIHLQGKGFLGFANDSTYESVGGSSSKSTFINNIDLNLNPGIYYTSLQSQNNYKNNNLVSTITNSVPYAYGGNTANKLFFPFSIQTITKNIITGYTNTTTRVFSTLFGRVTDNKSVTSDGWTIETQPSYALVSGNTSRLSQMVTTRTLGTDIYTATTTYNYQSSSSFRLTSQVTQNMVTSTYTAWDPYGNVKGTTVSVSDGTPSRNTVNAYDGYGRFLTSSNNVEAGLTSTASYQNTDGAVLSQTDRMG